MNFRHLRRALTFSGKHVSFVLPANCDNRMVGFWKSPQEEPHENKDAARRHSPPCQLHFWRILSVMTLALASISPAGSSASAYRIFMLYTTEPVISFKANIARSAGWFPVNYRGCFVFVYAEKGSRCKILLLLLPCLILRKVLGDWRSL